MNVELWLQTKLAGDWSAQAAASGLTEERLTALNRTFGALDSMIKVRLLLAGLFIPRSDRTRLQPLLAELSGQAATSQDEWVRATAAVVGDFSGPLDMGNLMAQFPLVRDTITNLSSQLEGLATPATLLPQSEQYMHRDISRLPRSAHAGNIAASAPANGASGGGQFRLRDPPTVPLADFGLGAPAGATPGGGLLSGLGGGSGSLDARSHAPATTAGGGADPLARRGLGGGETSMLRSRADVFHSTAFKDAKQAPPTPKGGAAGPGLALRLNRARSLAGPDGAALESPHQQATPAGQAPPGSAFLGPFGSGAALPPHALPHGAQPIGPMLGRRDSQGLAQNTPRYTASNPHFLVCSASGSFASGGAFAHPVLQATSTAEPPMFTEVTAGHERSHQLQDPPGEGGQRHGSGQLQAGQELSAEGFATGPNGSGWPAPGAAVFHEQQFPYGEEGLGTSAGVEPEPKRFRGSG